jgi:flagellar hook-length control protein FliK
MSIVADLFSLAGPTPPPAGPGERPDAAGFAGLLDAAGARPRGLLGLGRRLAEQVQAETARMDDNGPLVGGEPLINPGLLTGLTSKLLDPLINPGPGSGTKSDEPLINPGVPAGKTDGPLINPGAETKTGGPLINPGVETKDGQPLINPGETVAKDGAQVLPAETSGPAIAADVLETLAQAGQAVRADAAVAAVRQAVGRAPEVTASVPQAAGETAMAGLDIEIPAPDAAPAPGGPVTPASTTGDGASTGGGPQTAPADPTQARPAAERTALEVPSAFEGDTSQAEIEAGSIPAQIEAEGPAAVRAEAAAANRLSADAIAQISAQIIRRLEGRSTRFDIELNPHDLGKIDVRLDIDAEGRLAARLAFDNPAAAADLRGRVDDLRRDLEQAGFQLSEDAFSFADREGARERREGAGDGSLGSFARSAEVSEDADAAAQPALRVMARLGLDVRV